MNPICTTCPHRDPCMASTWNENGHPNPPTDGKAPLTCVHTCRLCCEPVMSTYTDPSPTERRVVPEGCPRWYEGHGSGMECDACREERDRLREQDPRWMAGREASMKMFESIIDSVKFRAEYGDNVVDLAAEQRRQGNLTDLSAALNPLVPLQQAFETGEGAETYRRVADLMNALVLVVWDDQTYIHEREVCAGSFTMEIDPYEWLNGLKMSVERHPQNPEAIAHEWVLVFTDRPVAARTWSRWTVARRRMILRMWEMIVREHVEGSNPGSPA